MRIWSTDFVQASRMHDGEIIVSLTTGASKTRHPRTHTKKEKESGPLHYTQKSTQKRLKV